MKILVTGSNGLLGNAIQKVSSEKNNEDHEFIFATRKDADLTNYRQTYHMISIHSPNLVIHLAGNVGGLFKNLRHKVQMFEDNLHINNYMIEKRYALPYDGKAKTNPISWTNYFEKGEI